MTDVRKFGGRVYRKWYYSVLLIIAVSLFIGLIFSLILDVKLSWMNMVFPSLLNTVVIWGGSMAIVNFSWRKFPWEDQPKKHLLVEIGLIVLFLIAFISVATWLYPVLFPEDFTANPQQNQSDVLITVLITFLIVTIHEAIFFYQQWIYNFSKSVKLEKDNLEVKYNALKAQVNPHFLFNSLNSLLTLVGDNTRAENYVQDLSGFLRYMMMSGNRDTISLQEELVNVEKYIRLQQQRFGTNFSVTTSISEAALAKHIPVLALQILFENCFQHNVITEQKPLQIRIFDEGDLLTVENNYQQKVQQESTGLGLKNIDGRYLLTGKKGISVFNDGKRFAVSIPLLTTKE